MAVAELVREASAIEPRFHALGAGDVIEKSAGELVTVADREAEGDRSQAAAARGGHHLPSGGAERSPTGTWKAGLGKWREAGPRR